MPFELIVRLGQDLPDLGVLPRLRYAQSFAANLVGALTHGTDALGVIPTGPDVDLWDSQVAVNVSSYAP
jgi:hypothetical protein